LAFYDTQFIGANLNVQSSSIDHMTLDGCTWTPDNPGYVACAKTNTFNDCVFPGINIGPGSYGSTESCTITNSSATEVRDVYYKHSDYAAVTSITAGVIEFTRPNWVNSEAFTFMLPGSAAAFVAGGGNARCFNIISIEQVGTTIYVTTDLPGSIPELSIPPYWISPLSCASITISGCTGALEPFNGHSAQPFGEISTQTMTGNDAGVFLSGSFGNIVSITVNVSQAYTGVESSVKICPLGQFGSVLLYAGAHNVVGSQYQPNINCKIAGTRVIMPGSTTGTQTGDVIPALAAGDNWLIGNAGSYGKPHFNNGSIGSSVIISGEADAVRPIVTVTVITDQGL
jgi:hypothetical protein